MEGVDKFGTGNVYNDEDMVIPVYYKENIIAYAPDEMNAKLFKFINEEEGPEIFNGDTMQFVSFYKEGSKTKLSHWYALDEGDVELFKSGKAMWTGDIKNN